MKPPTEHAEQVQVVDWLDFIAARTWAGWAVVDGWAIDDSEYSLKRPQMRLPYFAVANGGKRHVITAVLLKAEGVRAGIQDLVFMIPRAGYHGLVVEMKRVKGGVVSRKQKVWGKAMAEMGYRWEVCKGHQQAIDAITDYLNLGGTQ